MYVSRWTGGIGCTYVELGALQQQVHQAFHRVGDLLGGNLELLCNKVRDGLLCFW